MSNRNLQGHGRWRRALQHRYFSVGLTVLTVVAVVSNPETLHAETSPVGDGFDDAPPAAGQTGSADEGNGQETSSDAQKTPADSAPSTGGDDAVGGADSGNDTSAPLDCPSGSKPFEVKLCGADNPEIFPANPFLGKPGLPAEIGIFVVVLILAYLLGVAMFKSTISRGGSILGGFLAAMAMILVVALLTAGVCFVEYTFEPGWCVSACDDGESTVVSLASVGLAFNHVRWGLWAIAASAVALLLLVLKFATASGSAR